MYSRVFCLAATEPPPADLAAALHAAGLAVAPHFKGDDLGWTSGELRLPGGGTAVYLERHLAKEDDIRDELNSFAALLETCDYSPNSGPLMRHVIQSRQLVVLRKPVDARDEVALERLLLTTCQHLAAHSDGVYQIDGQGWFAADGTLLVQEY